MDQTASAALWDADGVDLLPGMLPMQGKSKISEWLNSLSPQLAGAKMLACTVEWQDIQIHGDLAYEWGINHQKIEFPPPRKTFENQGKIVLILKRQLAGSWKISLESWNGAPEVSSSGGEQAAHGQESQSSIGMPEIWLPNRGKSDGAKGGRQAR